MTPNPCELRSSRSGLSPRRDILREVSPSVDEGYYALSGHHSQKDLLRVMPYEAKRIGHGDFLHRKRFHPELRPRKEAAPAQAPSTLFLSSPSLLKESTSIAQTLTSGLDVPKPEHDCIT